MTVIWDDLCGRLMEMWWLTTDSCLVEVLRMARAWAAEGGDVCQLPDPTYIHLSLNGNMGYTTASSVRFLRPTCATRSSSLVWRPLHRSAFDCSCSHSIKAPV